MTRNMCGCRDGVRCRLCQLGTTRRSLPCVHEGDVIRPCPSCHGDDRHVRECDRLGETTRADCRKCPLRVPDATLLDPTPRGGRRLLITLDTDASAVYAASRPSHERYAARIGADHVTLTGRAGWGHVLHEKWRYRPFVAAYDRTLVLDTDTWVTPDAPDIFDAVPDTHVGMCRVDAHLIPGFDWREETRALCRSQEMAVPDGALDAYYNCGVWVGSRAHADYWAPPPRPGAMPGKWCDEEQWGRVQCARLGLSVHDYGRLWNHQWYLDKGFDAARRGRPYIYHFAGMAAAEDAPWRARLVALLESAST